MGFRFRKSVKIAPGIRLNVGKKSASVSFGGKGIRHTMSTTGRNTSTVGIPGSGLYYTKSSSSKRPSGSKSNSYANSSTYNYDDAYKSVKDFDDAIEYITSLHKECDYYYNWIDIGMDLPPFNILEKGPNELQAKDILNNYKPNIFEIIFKNKYDRKIKDLENKINFAIEKDKELYEEWKNKNELSKLILDGDLDSYIGLLQDVEFSNNLGGMIPSFNFKTSDKDIITIEYNINIDTIVPEQYTSLTKTGKLSVKNYTKTAYYEIVKLYVCGFALRIARNAFGLLPVETVIINTQNDGLSTQTGNVENNTIMSIEIDRDNLEGLNFDLIDPYDALNNFKYNVKFLKTKGFQPVEKLVDNKNII